MRTPESKRPIRAEQLQAVVDMATEDPRRLETIKDEKTAQVILQRLYSKLTTKELLERIQHSRFQAGLTRYLLKLMGRNTKALQDFLPLFLDSETEWESEATDTFITTYWTVTIEDYIERGEFKSAWEQIKKSYRGFAKKDEGRSSPDRDPFESAPYGGRENFSAPLTAIEASIAGLYQKMLKEQLVPQIGEEVSFETYVKMLPEQDRTSYYIPTGLPAADGRIIPPRKEENRRSIAGESFARNFMSGNQVGPTAQMVLAIAGNFAGVENQRRREQYESAVAEYERKQRGR
jgi:hypothetical protein